MAIEKKIEKWRKARQHRHRAAAAPRISANQREARSMASRANQQEAARLGGIANAAAESAQQHGAALA